jgi:hypothetical protein
MRIVPGVIDSGIEHVLAVWDQCKTHTDQYYAFQNVGATGGS